MTKKMKSTELSSVKWDIDGCSLKDMYKKLDDWVEYYGEDVTFDVGEEGEYGGGTTFYIRLMGTREETDQEYNLRIKQEAAYKEAQEKRDAAEFKRLSKKFKEIK